MFPTNTSGGTHRGSWPPAASADRNRGQMFASDGDLNTSTYLSFISEDHDLLTLPQGHRVSGDVLHQLSMKVAIARKDKILETATATGSIREILTTRTRLVSQLFALEKFLPDSNRLELLPHAGIPAVGGNLRAFPEVLRGTRLELRTGLTLSLVQLAEVRSVTVGAGVSVYVKEPLLVLVTSQDRLTDTATHHATEHKPKSK